MKTDYIVRATKFISEFFSIVSNRLDSDDVERAVGIYNRLRHRSVAFDHGASRYCLILADYVVKWDYSDDGVSCWGGCESEFAHYQQAILDGFDYLLAATTPVKFRGMTYYIMQRAYDIGSQTENLCDILTKIEYNYLFNQLGLDDIHSFNWGYLHGKPLLIDYACGDSLRNISDSESESEFNSAISRQS